MSSGARLGPAASLGDGEAGRGLADGCHTAALEGATENAHEAVTMGIPQALVTGPVRACSGSHMRMGTLHLQATTDASRGRQESPSRRRIVAAKVASWRVSDEQDGVALRHATAVGQEGLRRARCCRPRHGSG
jgi:hypothetical protein